MLEDRQKNNAKIIAFVGLPGSGKSTAVSHLKNRELPSVYFGGIILEAMKDASIEGTPENERAFREEIRQKEGKDFVVRQIIKQIKGLIEAGQHKIIVDGLYSWTEYKALKQAFPGELTVVALIASKKLRHHRLSSRPIRPLTNNEATQRDWAEIENLEKGGPIAMADYFIINDQNLEKLQKDIDKIATDAGF